MFPESPSPCLAEPRRLADSVRLVFGLLTLLALPGSLRAQFVMPTSYTITPGQGTADDGTYNYFDDGGGQLTDGIFGGPLWYDDLGNGNAYEWVGWRTVNPTLTFSFSPAVSIASVTLGFSRGSGGGVFLPSSVTIAGQSFTLTGEEFSDNLRQDLVFTLATPFTGGDLAINLSDENGNWIFLDEVRFTAVPEPHAVWFVGLAGVTVVARRLRQRAACNRIGRAV